MTGSRAPGSCPETLPVVYVHHGPRGHMVYADQPVLIVHVDDGVPDDRCFVRIAEAPPEGLVREPVSCSGRGSPGDVRRKERLVAWLLCVAAGLGAAVRRGRVQ